MTPFFLPLRQRPAGCAGLVDEIRSDELAAMLVVMRRAWSNVATERFSMDSVKLTGFVAPQQQLRAAQGGEGA
jgi:hypothetical protein